MISGSEFVVKRSEEIMDIQLEDAAYNDDHIIGRNEEFIKNMKFQPEGQPDFENVENLTTYSEGNLSIKEEIEIEETLIEEDNIKKDHILMIDGDEELQEDNKDTLNSQIHKLDIKPDAEEYECGEYNFLNDFKPTVDFKDEIKVEEILFLHENKLITTVKLKEELKCDINKETPLSEYGKCTRVEVKENKGNTHEGLDSGNPGINGDQNKNSVTTNGPKSEEEVNDATAKCIASENFQCQFCDYAAIDRSILRDHINVVHFGLPKYNSEYREYWKIHGWAPKKRLSNIKIHKLKHCDRREEFITVVDHKRKTYKCENCDYCTGYSSNIKKHMRVVHYKLKIFKCEHCDYRTDYSANLKKHNDGVHLKLRNYKCGLCRYAASQSSSLQLHIRAVHNQFQKYKCGLCDFVSTHSSALKQHINRAHDEKIKRRVNVLHLKFIDYKCKFCDYSTNRQAKLNVHYNAVHQRHKCERGYQCTSYSTALKKHKRI